jgi:hypothetical protein
MRVRSALFAAPMKPLNIPIMIISGIAISAILKNEPSIIIRKMNAFWEMIESTVTKKRMCPII